MYYIDLHPYSHYRFLKISRPFCVSRNWWIIIVFLQCNSLTITMSPHGYSWFDGLLRNPRSGVQTPQVLGYSPITAALILGSSVQTPTRGWGPTGYTGKVYAGAYRAPRAYDRGFKPLRGVILRGRGLGSHMSNQGTLWRRYPGERRENHPTHMGQDTRDWTTPTNWWVTNSPHSPCQLSAEGGTWWQDSSNYGKDASLGCGASRRKSTSGVTDESGCRWGKTLLKVSRGLTLEGTLGSVTR